MTKIYILTEMHSIEQGICPNIVLIFASNVLSLKLRTIVGQQRYRFYQCYIVTVLGHVMSSVT